MAIIARENWKPVVGHEGNYEISDYGRVRSLSGYRGINMHGALCFLKGRVLKPLKSKRGYLQASIGRNTLKIHRMVALSFFPIDEASKFQINHIDCDKENNCIENLEWCTNDQNIAHAVENGRFDGNRGESSKKAKLTSANVRDIRELLKTKLNEAQIANRFGVKRAAISSIKHGRTWSHLK